MLRLRDPRLALLSSWFWVTLILGQVLVAGRRVSIKIAAGGKEAWRAGELEALVRDFRS